MKRILGVAVVLAAAVAVLVLATGASNGGGNYKVRAIFDNASFVISGEDVKIAGVKVGKIDSLDVTKDKKAAVVLKITDPAYADFRTDAHCTVRLQGLIGEQFVECTPTQPGAQHPPELAKVPNGQPGAGQRLLPVQNTSSPVGVDLLNSNLRVTQRQRLSLIINELGTGLAGNADALRTVIRRANPALQQLDRVLAILAHENKTLAALARNSDKSLAPLARDKRQLADWVTKAGDAAEATAEVRSDFEENFRRLPTFLSELRTTAPKLGAFADAATPVFADLRAHATPINGFIKNLGPLAEASRPAIRSLGQAGKVAGPALVRTRALAGRFNALGTKLAPVGTLLNALLQSAEKTGGSEALMRFIFYSASAINGYDGVSHILRAALNFSPIAASGILPCAGAYVGDTNDTSCGANFGDSDGATTKPAGIAKAPQVTAARTATPPAAQAAAAQPAATGAASASAGAGANAGLLNYLLGSGSR